MSAPYCHVIEEAIVKGDGSDDVVENVYTPALAGMVDGGTTEGEARLVTWPEKRKGLVKIRGLDPQSWRPPILDEVHITFSLGLVLR